VGYYKKLDVAQQDDVERTMAWYQASGKDLPPYLHNWLMLRDERLWGAIYAWEASQVELPKRNRKGRRTTYRKPKVDPTTVSAISIVLSIWALAIFAVMLVSL